MINDIMAMGGFVETESGWKRDEVKYPEIKVKLIGEDGNAFNILGLVTRAMARGKVSVEERDAFYKEATSGDYDHLLATCMKWVSVY